MISICIPTHDMKNGEWFLDRALRSIESQTYKDYEIVITKEGRMAENTNAAIKRAKGDLIKILYMDDFLAHENSLQMIVDAFTGYWLVTGCKDDRDLNYHYPSYNPLIHRGINSIGSPSVLTFKNEAPLLFDEEMTWLLDCDYYRRLYDKYGEPTILNDINVVIGVGDHQVTHLLPEEAKIQEQEYMSKKYEHN